MATTSSVSSLVAGQRRGSSATPRSETRFDRRLAKILAHATEVFYEKGYEGASMRDLARSSGTSLSGLYYYFESKEKLLYPVEQYRLAALLGQAKGRSYRPHQVIGLQISTHHLG